MADPSPEELLEESFEGLDRAIERSNAQKAEMAERLKLIKRIALNNIDIGAPKATEFSEIVGVACGDPWWLQHAKVNYDLDHAHLVQLCRKLLDQITDSVGFASTAEQIAHMMADQLEQEILPELMLAEDGRTFRRAQAEGAKP